MSPRGQVGNGKRRLACTEAERAFTDALLAVYGQLEPLTQAEVAKLFHWSASAMSQYFNLQRSVPVAFVKDLYRVAQKAVDDVSAMPLRLDELLALHDEAGREGWSRKNGGVPAPRKPADLPSATEVPVLSGHDADRRSAVGAEASWDGIADVRQLLEAGRSEDAARLLDHAGSSLSAQEVQLSAASCRSLGFDDGAEAVLRSASRRGAEYVLDVVRELTRAGQHVDTAVLLLGGDMASDSDSASDDSSTSNGKSIHGTTRALDTEADLMMANSEPDEDAAAGRRLEPAAAGPFASSAGAAESRDRRYVFLPRQHDGCDAGPIAVDPVTGDCECPGCGAAGMNCVEDLWGETYDVEAADLPQCPDLADHVHCSHCDSFWRPVSC